MSELDHGPVNVHGFKGMNTVERALAYEFGPFRLEPATRRLLREGEPLPLTPFTGGVPREVLEEVESADWSPDGRSLAVIRKVENRLERLEYPIGRVLAVSTSGQCLDGARVSRDGTRVAVLACAKPAFSLDVVDGQGRRRTVWTGREWVSGFAWSPRGDELWFTTEARGRLPQARAVDLSGRVRWLAQLPGALTDVSREGGVLITTGTRRSGIRGLAPGESEERELSWLEGSAAVDLSPDGGQVLFGEFMVPTSRRTAAAMSTRTSSGSTTFISWRD